MFITKHKKVFVGISVALVLLALSAVTFFGYHVGIDFKGGTKIEATFQKEVSSLDLTQFLATHNISSPVIQKKDAGLKYIIKMPELSFDQSTLLQKDLGTMYGAHIDAVTTIGPSVGAEMTRKAILALILVSLGIVVVIGVSFKSISRPISSWKYGLVAIMTLLHDVAIPAGFFAVYSHFTGAEFDTLIAVAFLTILGLSVSDTIVVFDRIRENVGKYTGVAFEKVVGISIAESARRSINTGLSVILAVVALYVWGPVATANFALVLVTGLLFGTYSSLCLASPVLILWAEKSKNK